MNSLSWNQKFGKINLTILMIALCVCVSLILALTLRAFGADGTPSSGFDIKGLLFVLIPTIWASIGPLVIATVTKFINSTVGAHVPHGIQVILSSLMGAVAAGLGDGGATIAATAISGATSQLYAGSQPSTFLTEKQP